MRSDLFAGAVVLANVRNPRESSSGSAKYRPAVLVYRTDTCGWYLVGLTSQAVFKTTNQPRTMVWASRRNGLKANGYIWRRKMTFIYEEDVDKVIGVVDEHLAEVISTHCDISELNSARLRSAARRVLRPAA